MSGRIWVAGEDEPTADIEMDLVSAEAGESFILRANNPSFAPLRLVEAVMWLDGERSGSLEIGPLEPGERQDVAIDLGDVPDGEHVFTLQFDWQDNFHDRAASVSPPGGTSGCPGPR